MKRVVFLMAMIAWICHNSFGQNRWVKQYHPELTGPAGNVEVA